MKAENRQDSPGIRKLKEALKELLKTQTIERISISALCEKAGVNRKTFYAHFEKCEDVLSAMEDELVRSFTHRIDSDRNMIDAFLSFASENRETLAVLLASRSSLLKEKLSKASSNVLPETFAGTGLSSSEAKLVYIYSSAGAMAIISEWLRSGCVQPAEEISTSLRKMFDACVKAMSDTEKDRGMPKYLH